MLKNCSIFKKFKQVFLVYCLCVCFSLQVNAEVFEDDVRDLLLAGNVDTAASLLERDINWEQNKLSLRAKNSEYYGIILITLGSEEKAKIFLDKAIEKYPKNQELKNIRKHLDFYNKFYVNQKLNFSSEELKHIELNDLLYLYFNAANDVQKQDSAKALKEKIINKADKLDKNLVYFLTKIDYLLELKDPALDPKIEELALAVIKKNRQKLFPQTLEFYELASAYKALAIISAKRSELKQAKDYVQLAQLNIYKMKALWLEEDIKLYRPILKITHRETHFGYVLPQWILALRQEYDAFTN